MALQYVKKLSNYAIPPLETEAQVRLSCAVAPGCKTVIKVRGTLNIKPLSYLFSLSDENPLNIVRGRSPKY